MYIRTRQARLSPVNPYSAAAEWAAAMHKAARSGNELIESSNGTVGISSPTEASLLASWMDAASSHALTVVEYHTSTAGNDSSFA